MGKEGSHSQEGKEAGWLADTHFANLLMERSDSLSSKLTTSEYHPQLISEERRGPLAHWLSAFVTAQPVTYGWRLTSADIHVANVVGQARWSQAPLSDR